MADGTYANHTLAHIKETIAEQRFKANVTDLTDQIGIISIQGPNSRKIVEELSEMSLRDDMFAVHMSMNTTLTDANSKGFYIYLKDDL